jgi:hypothetical protein
MISEPFTVSNTETIAHGVTTAGGNSPRKRERKKRPAVKPVYTWLEGQQV